MAHLFALIAVLGTGVVYGTDVFCALVQRPALAQVDDRALLAVMGNVHRYGDRRMPVPGVIGIAAAVVSAVFAARSQRGPLYEGAEHVGAVDHGGAQHRDEREHMCHGNPPLRSVLAKLTLIADRVNSIAIFCVTDNIAMWPSKIGARESALPAAN